MRYQLFGIIAVVVLVSQVQGGCNKSAESGESDESEVISFFKNVGCDIKKGAEKVSDTAKPWVDEIGKSAKKFGNTVAGTFSDLKDKISGSGANSTTSGQTGVSSTEATSSSTSEGPTPESVDRRILLEVEPRCPEGQLADGRGRCRPIA